MGQIGPQGLFLFIGLLYLFLLLLTLYHIQRHPKVSHEGRHYGFVSTYTRTSLEVQLGADDETEDDSKAL